MTNRYASGNVLVALLLTTGMATAANLPISDGVYVSKPDFCEEFRRGELEMIDFEVTENGAAFSYPEAFCVVAEVKEVRQSRFRVTGDCDEFGEIWQSSFFLDVQGGGKIAIDGRAHQICTGASGGVGADAADLIEEWMQWNESCRGGFGDEVATIQACDRRADAAEQLERLSLCYGKEHQSGAEFDWHTCGPGSIHFPY